MSEKTIVISDITGGSLVGKRPKDRPIRTGKRKGPPEPPDGTFRALYRAQLKERGLA